MIKLILYKFCGLFVVDALPYKFDNEVTLTQFLFENTEYFTFLTVYYKNNLLDRLCRRPNIFHTKKGLRYKF